MESTFLVLLCNARPTGNIVELTPASHMPFSITDATGIDLRHSRQRSVANLAARDAAEEK